MDDSALTSVAPESHLALDDGSDHTVADWESAAAAVLRKAGRLTEDDPAAMVWTKLTRRTLDGVELPPLGTPELVGDITTAGRPTREGAWDVRALIADPDSAAADALNDLENGVTSLWLQLGETGIPVTGLRAALKDVLLDVAPVVLDAPGAELDAARAFAEVADGSTLAAGTSLGADPIGASVRGTASTDAALGDQLGEIARIAGEVGAGAIVVDGTAVHDLGASDAQELGYVIAVGAAYLRALTATGLSVDDAAGLIGFRVAATDEQFPTIAKFRAVRRLWARVLELSGVTTSEGTVTTVHGVTSRPMMSKYDPWVNMLRTTVAAFAAGVGGADAVTVLPFTAPLGLPDGFARRIARNTSALLIEEAHVAKVADPAGGSFAVEKLTDDLAVAGWAELGRIEEAGTIIAAAAVDALRSRIDEVNAQRDTDVARRKRPLTGLSEFPNLHETLPQAKPYPDASLPVRSYGHAFEALRDAPAADKVFLATMGTVAAHTARATFAANLLAAGGVDVVNVGRHDDLDAVLASYNGPDGGQKVVCLVGNDAAYAEWGTDLANALREAGASWVIVAGKPLDGVDDNCAMGVDALDFLNRTREKLS